MNASDSAAETQGADGPPLIGITSYLEQAQTGVWDVPASFLPKVYMDAVTDSGGAVVLLPPQPVAPGVIQRIVEGLDGLILSGGADVDPARYGQAAHESTGWPRIDRDEFELQLLDAALAAGVPFFGICRGAQVLNVLRGGTLIQHVPDVVGTEQYQLGKGVFNPIEVSVEPESRIASVLGESERATAHLYHHQAIDRVGDGLTVTSRSDDGIIQSVEITTHDDACPAPYAVAVQWHPEENVEDRRLFAGLVAAAREYRAGKNARRRESTREESA